MSDGDFVPPRALIEDWLHSTTEERSFSKGKHEIGQQDEAQRHRRQHKGVESTGVSNTENTVGAHHATTPCKDDTGYRKRTRKMRASHVDDRHLPQLTSDPHRRDDVHFRSNGENMLGLDSFLEPAPSVELRSPEGRIGHGHITFPKNRTSNKSKLGQSNSSGGVTIVFQPNDAQPAPALYERRPRRKTHENRYMPKANKRSKRKLATNAKKVASAPRDRKQKRREKSGTTVMHNFEAQNISQDRVTLKPLNNLGIFGNGRASSPVRRRPLPDLAFSELDFLNSRRDKVQDDEDKKRQKLMTKTAREDSEMSRYFKSKPDAPETSAKRKAEGHQERRSRRPDNMKSDLGVSGGRREFLGFGSHGPNSSVKTLDEVRTPSVKVQRLRQAQTPTPSNSYFTWSQSVRSQRVNGSAKVVKPNSHTHMRNESPLQNTYQQRPVGSVSSKKKPRVETSSSFSANVKARNESGPNVVIDSKAHTANVYHPPRSQLEIVVKDGLHDSQGGRVNHDGNTIDTPQTLQSTVAYRDAGQQTILEEHAGVEPRYDQQKVIHPEIQPSRPTENALEATTTIRQPGLAEEIVDEVDSLLRLCKALTPSKKDKALHILLRDQTAVIREGQDLRDQDGGHKFSILAETDPGKSCKDTVEPKQRPVSRNDEPVDRKPCQTRIIHKPETTPHTASGSSKSSRPSLSGSKLRTSALSSSSQLRRTSCVNMAAVNGYNDIFTRQLLKDRHPSLMNEQERRSWQHTYESEEQRLSEIPSLDQHHLQHYRPFDNLEDTERPVLRTMSSYFSDQQSVSRSNLYGTSHHEPYSSPIVEYEIPDHFGTMSADETTHTESLAGLQQPEIASDRSAEHSQLIEMSPSVLHRDKSREHVPHKLSIHDLSGRDFGGEASVNSRQAPHSDRPQMRSFWTPNKLY